MKLLATTLFLLISLLTFGQTFEGTVIKARGKFKDLASQDCRVEINNNNNGTINVKMMVRELVFEQFELEFDNDPVVPAYVVPQDRLEDATMYVQVSNRDRDVITYVRAYENDGSLSGKKYDLECAL